MALIYDIIFINGINNSSLHKSNNGCNLFAMKRIVLLFLVPAAIFCLITPCYAAKSREELEREKIISKALMLEEELNQLVIGQEEAVKTTADAIIRYAAGVNDLKIRSRLFFTVVLQEWVRPSLRSSLLAFFITMKTALSASTWRNIL